MSRPRILVVVGTPLGGSLNHALAGSYAAAAQGAGAEVRRIDLAEDGIPPHPRSLGELKMPRDQDDLPLDPLAAGYIEQVNWADHLVFFYPQWWGTYPAALKAFIDRVFLTGFAFRRHPRGRLWDKMLSGRTARIVMTMDSPRFWNRFVYRNAAETSLSKAVLAFCGVRVRQVNRFAEVRFQKAETRERWLTESGRLGASDAATVTRRAAT